MHASEIFGIRSWRTRRPLAGWSGRSLSCSDECDAERQNERPRRGALSGSSRGVVGLPDVMIAAIAIRSGLAIVTGNTAHFEQVRAAKYDLFIDNWRLP
jgi:hypothetical protein